VAVVGVRFIGGPLDGQSYTASVAAAVADTFNRTYPGNSYSLGGDGNYHYAGASTGPGLGGSVSTKQVGSAWHRLMHVFAVQTPQSIRRSRAARAHIRRLSR
jgi:hypothetical protein